jgi:hypothetical protein
VAIQRGFLLRGRAKSSNSGYFANDCDRLLIVF